ncbi:MAG: heme exporter protein CcmB [Robiginitomaculum sp.]|nr:MAG: heme exporter protein CcmB [Robiginitomaculum sp.]
MSWGQTFWAILGRDMRMARRAGGGWAQGAVFFLLFILLAAFAIGPETRAQGPIAPALVWLAAVLASQLSLDQLFRADLEDGSLDILVTSGASLSAIASGKTAAHWLASFAPVTVLSPLAALMLGAKVETLVPLMASLAIGGPAFVFFGAMGAALAAGRAGGGLLVLLLSGPLLAPPLIFGAGVIRNGALDSPDMKLLMASSLMALVLSPLICAAALRVHLE